MLALIKKTALAVALACLIPVAASAAEPPAATTGAEQAVTTPGGKATFLLPAGWGKTVQGNAVILTNADEGVMLRGPLKRRLMELMFDGEAQAQAAAKANAKANRVGFDAFRKLLQIPGDAQALAGLAPRYRNEALGDIVVTHQGGKARIDVGAFSSEMVTQPQPDGSLAFVTIDPVAAGFQLIRADKDGVRKLIVRDGQHEYVFDEVK